MNLSSAEVREELRFVYSDPFLWLFIVAGIGYSIMLESLLAGVLVTALPSLVYMAQGHHRSQ